jgi:hypothetical protein
MAGTALAVSSVMVRWLIVVVLAGGCAAAVDDSAIDIGSAEQPIVNGTVTAEFPATGMLLGGSPDGGMFCSATLIGCDTVLTAAHCVCMGTGADCSFTTPQQPTYVYFQNAGFFQVESLVVNPQYNEAIEYDAAVLHLAEPVTGIRPAAVASSAVAAGSAATIVGFGRTGGDVYEYGIKRQGTVTTRACAPELGVKKLCWQFDGTAASSESNVCHGDSGGSTYVMDGGVPTIVGVHSTTNQMSCLESPGTYPSADTSVFDHLDFITGGGGTVSTATCGDLPAVGDPEVAVTAETGRVELGETADFALEVPRGTAQLRVALNSTDGVDANLDLFIKTGDTASFSDCGAAGSGPHGFCSFDSPATGSWAVEVSAGSTSGAVGGDFQMTATIVGGAPVGVDDAYGVEQDGTLEVAADGGVLANDEGTARGSLSAAIDRQPEHGTVELAADGSFRYQPEAGFEGQDSFSYQVSDGSYHGPAEVVVMVGGAGDESGMLGGCGAAGGTGTAGGLLVLLLCGIVLRVSQRRCGSRRG